MWGKRGYLRQKKASSGLILKVFVCYMKQYGLYVKFTEGNGMEICVFQEEIVLRIKNDALKYPETGDRWHIR